MTSKTLLKQAQELVRETANRNPQYHTLTTEQKENFTAAAMRDLGKYAYELVIESGQFEIAIMLLIEYLESTDEEKRQQLKQRIANLIIEAAINNSRDAISDALDEADMHLSIARQFYSGIDYDVKLALEGV